MAQRHTAQTNTTTELQLRCLVCPLPLLQADALLVDVAGQRTLLDQAGKAHRLLAQVRQKAVTKPARSQHTLLHVSGWSVNLAS